MDKVRYLIGIVFCLLMMGVGTVKAEDINVSQQQENVDAKDIVFGHIQDSYEWQNGMFIWLLRMKHNWLTFLIIHLATQMGPIEYMIRI